MKKNYSIVFTPIPISKGMAGTKRLNNIIYYLPENQFNVHNFIITGGSLKKILSSIKLCYFLVKKKSKNSINILYHYSNINFHTILPCLVAKLLGYKIIIDLVEDYNHLKKSELYIKGKIRISLIIALQSIYRYLIDGYIAISKHLENEASKLSRKKKPTVQIPISFNPIDFTSSPKGKSGKQDNFRIFYGGSFGDKDGLEYLLPAFDKFAKENSDAIFITTGKINKNYRRKYFELKESMHSKDRIIEMGFVSEKKYLDLIKNSHVLCMTRNNSEYANAGFPFKLGAFLATGNPVIVTEVSNIKDYLSEENCFLIKPESSKEIYEALCKIKFDIATSIQVGEKGKAIAFKYFNAKCHVDKFLELIDKM